jgi:hypothetical protein
VGEPKLGSTVPRLIPGPFTKSKGRIARFTITHALSCCQSAASRLAPAALCAAGLESGAAVAAEQSGEWGVSDPHFAAPFFAPRPALRGSLTPHVHVAFVRQNRALSW